MTMLADNRKWSLTGVYGPQLDQEKVLFMQEITDPKTTHAPGVANTGRLQLDLPSSR